MAKRKIAVFICVIAVLSLSAVTAFAAGGEKMPVPPGVLSVSASNGGEITVQPAETEVECPHCGEAFDLSEVLEFPEFEWFEFKNFPGFPDDYEWEEAGDFIIERSVMVKSEDGKMMFSEDGGETWSETPPEGTEVFPDGRVTHRRELPPMFPGENSIEEDLNINV
ncbi:MAG: hypothetical protein FWG44_02075 [Oscillospiraceae bacterium]|nr:hypothetical protein [Oscillospiraceae bacterium]